MKNKNGYSLDILIMLVIVICLVVVASLVIIGGCNLHLIKMC